MQRGAGNLLDYTVPLVSLIKGERIVKVLERQFEGWDIDDMWVPMSCVSTDLTTAEIVVHREGPAARAIRTSVAIPGVLPPVAHEGHLLADGGVLDNLPAGEFGADPSIGVVIASDVAPPYGPSAKGDHGLWVSGWARRRTVMIPSSIRVGGSGSVRVPTTRRRTPPTRGSVRRCCDRCSSAHLAAATSTSKPESSICTSSSTYATSRCSTSDRSKPQPPPVWNRREHRSSPRGSTSEAAPPGESPSVRDPASEHRHRKHHRPT